jgi:very-short-patch-repair endonuclease
LKEKLKEYLEVPKEIICRLIQIDSKNTVRFINIDSEPWFLITDIVKIIGNAKGYESLPSPCIKLETIPGIKRPVRLVSADGLRLLLQKSRSLNVPLITDGLSSFLKESPVKLVYACKETSWLRIIKEAFFFLESELQFSVGTYRIDLYFPQLLVAVECDENGHSDRSSDKEVERQEFIQKTLKCQFVRFNPDVENFNIGTTIGKITKILCGRKNVDLDSFDPPEERKLKKKWTTIRPVTDGKKPCNICNEVKGLDEFYIAREHKDKRENVCKICRKEHQEEIAKIKQESLPPDYEKTCTKCKHSKPLEEFYKDKQKTDGHGVKCKECYRKHNKELETKPKLEIVEKLCTMCNITKPSEDFHVRKTAPDGRSIYCVACTRKKALKYYHENKDRALDIKKAWRESKKVSPKEEEN